MADQTARAIEELSRLMSDQIEVAQETLAAMTQLNATATEILRVVDDMAG
tara:strand:- start:8 stop:157 length:150 start_codon:yes stop_codon:yes gene_type:complete